jgi:superoxide dismutase
MLILATMMLSACSLLDEVNNSLDYVNEAKSYINSLNDFAEEAPQLIQDAAVDPEVKQDLENQLNTLVDEINEFNTIEAPAIAEDIHQDLVTKNEALIDEINTAMENGELALEKLENSEIINTVNDVTSLLESIEKLEL